MSGFERYFVETAIPDAPKHTGLVHDIGEANVPAFLTYRQSKDNSHTKFAQTAVESVHILTPLNRLYFSDKNLEYLQNEIRFHIWEQSDRKHIIERQSDDDLKVIMRSYYLQYAAHNPNDVRGDLESLNSRVLGFCVNRIMSEIGMYLHYRKDLADFPAPIANPVNANITGTLGAEFKGFF